MKLKNVIKLFTLITLVMNCVQLSANIYAGYSFSRTLSCGSEQTINLLLDHHFDNNSWIESWYSAIQRSYATLDVFSDTPTKLPEKVEVKRYFFAAKDKQVKNILFYIEKCGKQKVDIFMENRWSLFEPTNKLEHVIQLHRDKMLTNNGYTAAGNNNVLDPLIGNVCFALRERNVAFQNIDSRYYHSLAKHNVSLSDVLIKDLLEPIVRIMNYQDYNAVRAKAFYSHWKDKENFKIKELSEQEQRYFEEELNAEELKNELVDANIVHEVLTSKKLHVIVISGGEHIECVAQLLKDKLKKEPMRQGLSTASVKDFRCIQQYKDMTLDLSKYFDLVTQKKPHGVAVNRGEYIEPTAQVLQGTSRKRARDQALLNPVQDDESKKNKDTFLKQPIIWPQVVVWTTFFMSLAYYCWPTIANILQSIFSTPPAVNSAHTQSH